MFELFINLAKLVSSVTAYDRTNCRHRGLRYRKMTIHEVVWMTNSLNQHYSLWQLIWFEMII